MACVAGLGLAGAACSSGPDAGVVSATTVTPVAQTHAVGSVSRTFVDPSRPTPANGGVAGKPDRTLETTVVYPAVGPPGGEASPDAPADTSAGPYPLVVLSHGLGSSEQFMAPLAEAWASAGYVVAVPRFPLTNAVTEGGPNGADVQSQPGDVSFVIDQVLAEAEGSGTPLSGLVDGETIALAGHSNGGITTLGAVANSCCREPRAGAAIVLAGVNSPFADGSYDLSATPPILFVHGVNDELIAYNQTVELFNAVRTPKGLLTLDQSGHGEWLVPTDPAFPVVVRATTDFLDAELRGDTTALTRLPQDQEAGRATMHWAGDDSTDVTVETAPEPETDRKASLSAQDGLRDGQTVTVTWSGFLPGKTINIVQCAGDGRGGSATCDISGGRILQPDPTGEGTMDIVVHTGDVGPGVCDAANPCTLVVNDAGLQDEHALIRFPITFAP